MDSLEAKELTMKRPALLALILATAVVLGLAPPAVVAESAPAAELDERTARILRSLAAASVTVRYEEREYYGQPIDLSVRDADLVEVLRSFSRIGGFDLVIDPAVTGTVTAELHQVPWDQALEQILRANGLGMEVSGRVAGVAPLR